MILLILLRFSLYFHSKSKIYQKRHPGESRYPEYQVVAKTLAPGFHRGDDFYETITIYIYSNFGRLFS
jgi:hypothetical protein